MKSAVSETTTAAIALFLPTFAQLNVRRWFEWLFAITAMGGYKVRADVGVS